MASELRYLEERLQQSCMEAHGFTELHRIDPVSEDDDKALGEFAPRPSAEEAAAIGYAEHMRPELFDRDARSTNFDHAFSDALYGPEWEPPSDGGNPAGLQVVELDDGSEVSWWTDGCAGQVTELLYGDEVYDFKVSEWDATYYPHRELMESDAIAQVHKAWSECMANAGHGHYQQPADVASDVAMWRMDYETGFMSWDEFNAAQIALAVTDAECAEEVDLDSIRLSVFWSLIASHMEEREADSFAYQDRAARLLDEGQDLLANTEWD